MNTSLKLVLTTALLGTFAVPAFADDDDRCGRTSRAEWMSAADAATRVTGLGYDVREVEEDDGCWEIEAREDGRKLEIKLHPVTGEVVKRDYDD